jgi:hypothetical protein
MDEEVNIDPTDLANTYDEWSQDLENAERDVAAFEAF